LSVAEKLAGSLGDDGRRGRVAAALSNTFFSKRWLDCAVETGTEALRLSEAQADVALQISARLRLGAAYYQLGDYRRAADLLRRAIKLIGDGRLHERFGLTGFGSVMGRFWLVRSLIELGEFPDAIVRVREADRIATSADHPFSLIAALVALGEIHLRQGSVMQAIPAFERALEIGRAREFRVWFAFCSASLGYAHDMVNRAAAAIPLLEQVASVEEVERPRRIAWLAAAHLVAGGAEEATRLAGQALELARRQKEQGIEAWTLRLFGEIATRGDASAFGSAAVSSYREALALASELGMRPLVAHCHLGLGKLHCRTGDGAKAAEHLTTASAMYREMDMRFWLEKAEAVLTGAGS
jgi:tetratricopeptide (TPR) repeat protein